jgi:hypothetical protein
MISRAATIVDILSRLVPRSGPESRLAEDVRAALVRAGVLIQIESTLSDGRVDIRLDGTAVELKVQGSYDKVLRQLERYAKDQSVVDVVLVTASAKLRGMPSDIGGKQLHVVYLPRL